MSRLVRCVLQIAESTAVSLIPVSDIILNIFQKSSPKATISNFFLSTWVYYIIFGP
jgi:hypothetical protein